MDENLIHNMPKAKQKITNTMFFLLHTKDFDEISVEQLCHITELSRTTFYRYFDDKYDIILQYVQTTLLQSLDASFTQESLRQYLDTFLMEDSMNRVLIRLINAKGNRELQSKLYKVYNNHYTEYYKTNFVQDDESDALVKMMSEYTCSAVIRLINWWIDENFPVPTKRLEQFISYMIKTPIDFPDALTEKD